ncbi:hypothetical protein OIU78_012836 [Salix suchowensis]|nr:hypothetical protein OIU78_012836 [Salix suchowensis]
MTGQFPFSHRAPLALPKQVIVINDQFPGPLLNATTNDVLNINVHNNLTEPFLMTWRRTVSYYLAKTGHDSFQVKDQIGSFFYFPSLLLHKAAGGYGPIRVNNREVIPLPFPQPHGDIDVLIGDWYSADHRDLRALLDNGIGLQNPIGILINGRGGYIQAKDFKCGLENFFELQDSRSSNAASFATPNSDDFPSGPLPSGPQLHDYFYSIEQARSIRWNLSAGAARPNPQGSYHYGRINASRRIVLRNGEIDTNRHLYTVNGVSFVHQGTPLKMADYFELESSRTGNFPDTPTDNGISTLGASVINANYREFYHLVFENPTPYLQTWHLDGYNFFVVGMRLNSHAPCFSAIFRAIYVWDMLILIHSFYFNKIPEC